MESLRLVIPDEAMLEQIAAYRQAMLAAGSSMDGCGSLRRQADPAKWLADNRMMASEETVLPHLVPATQFVCLREDGKIVGMIQLRHRFNEYLREFGGHIGYSVHPQERRKGYAKWMLGSVLPYCRDVGLRQVMISCLTNNEASRRTILAHGGVYDTTVHEPNENVDLERYWITL